MLSCIVLLYSYDYGTSMIPEFMKFSSARILIIDALFNQDRNIKQNLFFQFSYHLCCAQACHLLLPIIKFFINQDEVTENIEEIWLNRCGGSSECLQDSWPMLDYTNMCSGQECWHSSIITNHLSKTKKLFRATHHHLAYKI